MTQIFDELLAAQVRGAKVKVLIDSKTAALQRAVVEDDAPDSQRQTSWEIRIDGFNAEGPPQSPSHVDH